MSIKVTISFPNHTSFRTSTIEVAGFQPCDARIRPQRQANMPIKASHLWWTWAWVYDSPFSPSPTIIALPNSKCNWMLTFMIFDGGIILLVNRVAPGMPVRAASYSQKQNNSQLSTMFCLKSTPSNLHKNFGCCHVIHVIVPDSDRPMWIFNYQGSNYQVLERSSRHPIVCPKVPPGHPPFHVAEVLHTRPPKVTAPSVSVSCWNFGLV